MPLIKPFRAFRYDARRVDPSRVVAPPYDVIDGTLRAELHGRDPLNVVRLILGEGADPYNGAAGHLDRWLRDSILVKDPRPAIYFLEQEFTLPDGTPAVRHGFIAACRLEDFGGSILPHENTHSGPKEDRLRLMEATGAMFSQIFALYPDPGLELRPCFDSVRSRPPDWEADYDGVRNALRVSVDDGVNLALAGFLRNRKVVIADGHHRYETALAYRNARRLENPDHDGHEPYNFVPMYCTNMHEPGMVVLPTHRLLRAFQGFDSASFMRDLEEYFTLRSAAGPRDLENRLGNMDGRALGLVTGGGECRILELNERGERILERLPPVIGRLNVVVLDRVVFGALLGINGESRRLREHVDYERDAGAAVSRVLDGSAQAAFIMNPLLPDQVRLVAEAGHTLPQKSTYYFPKLLSGVVNYSFRAGWTG